MDLSDDQDTTDLDKALTAAASRGCDTAVVLGQYSGSGGRLDHTFGIIQSLLTALTPRGPFADILVLSEESVMQLLLPHQSTSQSSAPALSEGHKLDTIVGSACGLIPIAGPCLDVSTRGLQWDVSHQKLSFGGLISTSNRAAEEQVWVSTDAPLLWTMSFVETTQSGGSME
jgi:thiamine pyrophosphokinase